MKNKNKVSGSSLKISELAQHLRREHLFVTSERQWMQKLNSKVCSSCGRAVLSLTLILRQVLRTSERLYHLNWLVRQHRLIVEQAFLNQGSDVDMARLCYAASALDSVSFCDSYKKLGSKEPLFSQLLTSLRLNPKLVAQILATDVPGVRDTTEVYSIIVSCLYGDCLVQEDRLLLFHVVRELATIQVVASDEPRRLLRHGSCAFSRILKLYQDTLSATRLFLISALREAVISVLIEDDLYLDIDAERAVVRFPAEERNRHFGREGTAEYKEKMEKYKLWATEKLESLVSKFVRGIRESLFCFPEHLRWIVRDVHSALTSSQRFSSHEVGAICSDLTFNQFICHAIMYPELYGIVDMHITPIARFNLMQVAQVIQVLAMSKFEKMDSRFRDVCSRFESDNNSLSNVIDLVILNGANTSESPVENVSPHVQDVVRTCVFITEYQLSVLTNFLHEVHCVSPNPDVKSSLETLLRNLPRVPPPDPQSALVEDNDRSKSILNKVRRTKSTSAPQSEAAIDVSVVKEVLVVPIQNMGDDVLPGMLSEEKVLDQESKKRQVRVRMSVDGNLLNDETESIVSGSMASEKRTRFSQDQESIGTSDNLEAISEGASTHSVESSIESENENENDNLSDMVSANVSSGRGTPNVSGRETPSSHSSSDGEDQVPVNEPPAAPQPTQQNQRRALNTIPVAPPARSGTQNDIEEKFGKFECQQSNTGATGDETKSLLSDTWSTDVLGSDSEALEQHDATHPHHPLSVHAPHSIPHFGPMPLHMAQAYGFVPEGSETASQSDAWSTDVLTSDTERLREFDVEDPFAAVADAPDGEEGPQVPDSGESGRHDTVVLRNPSARTASGDSDQDGQLDSLTMQTLGRTSFNLRQKSTDDDVVDLLCSLKSAGNAPVGGHRASISELLSLHPADGDAVSSPTKPLTEEPFSLIEFEKEIAAVDADFGSNLIDLSSPSSIPNPQIRTNADKTDSGISVSSPATPGEPVMSNGSVVKDLSQKPNASSGAIPKTTMNFRSKLSVPVSSRFSRTSNQSEAEDKRRGGSFFKLPSNLKRNLQEKMKSLSKRGSTSSTGEATATPDREESVNWPSKESTDDILNKYKDKKSVSGDASEGDALLVDLEKGADGQKSPDMTPCSIASTKRKLRRVLSQVDIRGLPISSIQSGAVSGPDAHHELIKFLRLLLSEAKHLANAVKIVAIQETIRCVESLDDKSCQQIFWSLREDYQRRSPFIAYLLQSKQSLLSLQSHMESLFDHLSQEKTTCLHNLVSVCVKQHLEKKERAVAHFVRCFQKLSLPDEKVQVVEKFLQFLYQSLDKDPVWQMASDELVDYAREVMERCVMSQIYMLALYPNGDGDVLRDQILHQHICKLSRSLTVEHKDLRIPAVYHSEAPWLSAQEEIATINAFKTPKEKVQCVVRTCTVIMSLLSLASDRSVPAADDLMPVLVFVIVKANPPSLLSTVQYVTSFYESKFEGEEAYWWTQFSSVVEFIKTMDY